MPHGDREQVELYPEDFDEFEALPVVEAITEALEARVAVLEKVRDDAASPDSLIRSAIARITGIREAMDVYNELKNNVEAGEASRVLDDDPATEEMGELERALNERYQGDQHNVRNGGIRAHHVRHGRRRYIPG